MSNGNGYGECNLVAEIKAVDPMTLKNDPELDKLWPLEDLHGPSELAFIDDVGERGVLDPLKISPDGRFVWDGRRRLRAAKRFPDRVKIVPVIRCREEDRSWVILFGITHRRNMSPSLQVFVGRPWWGPIIDSSRSNRVKNLRKPLSNSEGGILPSGQSTIRQLAEKLGIDHKEFNRCEEVLKLFEEHPDAREYWEPRLLKGQTSFWQILRGIKGDLGTRIYKGKTPAEIRGRPYQMCLGAVKTLALRAKDWEQISGSDEKAILEELRGVARGKKKVSAEEWSALAGLTRNKLSKWFERLAEEAEEERDE